ncbi:transporter substrate-binding domain-containing protein [uncultured Cohaesibacter sp.]|uniref:transporter substrate-binding domain-containing protein n=1 Tax=uncultured Cohaesibacter sp. TaxID=1002546 RepID=UPI0029C699CF|nr:transporter substrate-binding domain-containing protein [uncultured Cohaesibacter sp.]
MFGFQVSTTGDGVWLSQIARVVRVERSLDFRELMMKIRMLIFLSLMAVFLVGSLSGLKAVAQETNAPVAEESQIAPSEEEDEADTESQGDVGANVNLRNRPTQSSAPVASEEWAKAGFTGFINSRQRLAQPDQELLDRGLRLLTTDDFPYFNFRRGDGEPEGYHVELVRSLCEELNIACTLKIVPFSSIPFLLDGGSADVAVAGLAIHPSLLETLGFSNIYLQRPARFVRLKEEFVRVDAHSLDGQPVAVQGGSAHEAYLKAYFPNINRVPVTDLQAARRILTDKTVKAIFGDAFQLLPLVSNANSPLIFAGKPYYDSHFFGDGMAMAYARNQAGLGDLLNYGLLKLEQKGRLAELYARHFALDVYATY